MVAISQSLPCPSGDCALGGLLGEASEAQFDALAKAVAMTFGCPVGAITIVETDRQWFKAYSNPNAPPVPIEHSICRHSLSSNEVFVVEDLASDERFRTNPLVCAQGLRFYAGRPISVRIDPEQNAIPIGALCVIDVKPREFSQTERATLEQLGLAAQILVQAAVDAALAEKTADRLNALLTEQHRLHRHLRQGEKIAGFGSWRLCLADNRVEWSDQVYAIHEVPVGQEEVLDDALTFYPPADRDIIASAVEQAITTGRSYDVEVDFITARGRQRRVRAMGEVEKENGETVALIGVFQDVTDRYRLEQALVQKANTDEMTGIASRRRFNECFDHKTDAPRAAGRDVVLILIDLDRFKEANDLYGHAAGDELLVRTAEVLSASWLKGSFAARLGGGEFVLIVTDPELIGSLEGVIQRLLAHLKLSPSADPSFTVSGTIGAVRTRDPQMGREQMTGAADRALYAAKNRQRGSAVLQRDGEDFAILPDHRAAREPIVRAA